MDRAIERPPDRPVATSKPMPRRNVFDPLEPTHEPRWYTVRNMHGALLDSRPLAAGSDLKRVFVENARMDRRRLAARGVQLDRRGVLLHSRHRAAHGVDYANGTWS